MTTTTELAQYAIRAALRARTEASATERPREENYAESALWSQVATALTAAYRLQVSVECTICAGSGTLAGPWCNGSETECTGATADERATRHRHATACPNPAHTA
jgi:hypothetical protein